MFTRSTRVTLALSCAAVVVLAGAAPAVASSAAVVSGGVRTMTVPSAASAQARADAAVSSAQQQAAESGQPVVVEELTTPTEQTTAMPDGTTQLEQWTVPVRVPRDGGWVPVDTKLERDGEWYSPSASVANVRFSAGGSTVVSQTQTSSGEWVSETWTHGKLPAPTVEGDTATYAEVMPGVDLKLTATATGMASVYVVKSESAARSSGLSELRTVIEGATLTSPQKGLLKARAADGSSLLANQPLWWDSSGGGTFKEPGQEMPPTPVEYAVSSNGVTMDVGASVEAEMARSQKPVTYPIFIDPDWAPGMTASWDTDKAYPNAVHLTTDPLYVGNYSTWHSDMFFRFPIGSVAGKQILKAVLGTTLKAVKACPPGPISSHYINYTSIPSPGFTWNQEQAMMSSGQMKWSGIMQSWTGPTTCGATSQSVGWTVTPAITSQLAASKPSVDIAFAGDNATSRKHFAKAASLTISYNTPPSTPTGAKFSSPDRPCGTAAAPTMIGQTDVTVVVDQRDPDGGNVDVNFDLAEAANLGVVVKHTTGGLAAQGLKYGTFTGLTNGKTYAWHARGSDWLIDGVGYSPWCYFTVDTTAPAMPSVAVPAGGVIGQAITATFTVLPSDGVDFVAYTVNAAPPSEPFVFDRFTTRPACGSVQGLVHIACPNASGIASVTVAPADGVSTIWAVSYDKAGNPAVVAGKPASEAGRHGMGVQVTAANSPVVSFASGHVWRTQPEPSPLGASIPDSHTSAPVPLTLGRDTLRGLKANPLAPGSTLLKSVLGFADPATTGLTGPDFTSSSSVAAFAGSYAVAAWLKPGTSGTGTAVSMGAGSATRLAVSAAGWEFCVAAATGSNCVTAPRPTGDQWVHVAGVVDVVNGQLRLYLDGSLAASVLRSDGAQNLGSSTVDVGVSRNAGAVTARWPGQIADVAVFSGVPSSSQLGQLRLGQDPAEG